ncbi:hypothetical protein K1T71_014162 [Dendrolimus kikuchii]|uniref:Uncharacterized protein n=1 Tax=Dendrolimus kikuchii TaxID=765133 RepID=A0ACC1CF71_9NEOP|nr:hypothetical protein K1T71_014162 [Dendrolimus kikuchii]
MPKAIHFRIAGQLATIGVQGINSCVMLSAMQDKNLMKDPQINTMVSLQATYLTVWNIGFLLLYSLLALACDLSTVLNRDDLVSKSMRRIRENMFGSAVLPITVFIFVFFWPVFLYDRSLIFPEFIDKIFSLKSNLVMHFWILPLACWELAFLPRSPPKSHKTNIQIISLYALAYNAVIFINYYRRGLWSYPLLGMIYGTIYFPLFITFVYFLCLYIYYKQWSWTAYFWGTEKQKK